MTYTIITCSSAFSSIWKYTNEPDVDIKWAFKEVIPKYCPIFE